MNANIKLLETLKEAEELLFDAEGNTSGMGKHAAAWIEKLRGFRNGKLAESKELLKRHKFTAPLE